MTETGLSLDQWISQIMPKADARNREYIKQFQQDWEIGARLNPLIFPFQQDVAAWKDSLAWFVRIETFKIPTSEKAETSSRPAAAKPVRSAAPAAEAATIILEIQQDKSPASGAEQAPAEPRTKAGPSSEKTSPPQPVSTANALDDLETLIMESSSSDQETTTAAETPVKTPEPAPVKKAAVRTAPPASETKSGSEDLDLDLDDLDTMEWKEK